MKKKLSAFPEIQILRRNEKLLADCCYILTSESVASNTYFETKRDIIRAHQMVKRHMSPIMDILDYLITPHGWMFVVAIKSKTEILKIMGETDYESKKIKEAIKKQDISVIISECIRYAISGMAGTSNRINRRKGTLVRQNFSRFIFEGIAIAQKIMSKMKAEEIKLCHQRKRYRPSMKRYDIEGELMKNGDVFLSSKKQGKAYISGFTEEKCVSIIGKSSDVLHQLIKKTFLAHFPKKPQNSTSVSTQNTS